MRINLRSLFICLLLSLVVGTSLLFAEEKVEPPVSCKLCGMSRVAFARSRMLITYADGTTTGTCSLHCAAKELKSSGGKQVKSIQVADYDTGKLIDAKSAVWVIGGNKQGVMTSLAKWAFTFNKATFHFIRENGGNEATFNDALKMAETEE